MRNNRLAYILVSITVLLWATAFAVEKLLLENLSNLQLMFFFSSFSTLSLFIVILFQKKTKIMLSYTFKDYIVFAYMGFLGIFLYSVLLFKALSLLPAQDVNVINYLWPIMVVIFANIILKERFTLFKIIGTIVSFAGILIVITKGDPLNIKFSSLVGVLYTVGATVCYALFSVLGKKQDYEKFTSVMFYYLFSTIYSTVLIFAFSKIPTISVHQAAGLVWLGVFANGIAYVFWFLALKYGDTYQMSNMIFLTPFLSLICISVLVGERILISSILGLFVTISGIVIQSFGTRKADFKQDK